jgi:transposase
MSTPFYDTDLTDAAWALVAPVLPAARPGGRPRTTNLRAVLTAVLVQILLSACICLARSFVDSSGQDRGPNFRSGGCLSG